MSNLRVKGGGYEKENTHMTILMRGANTDLQYGGTNAEELHGSVGRVDAASSQDEKAREGMSPFEDIHHLFISH